MTIDELLGLLDMQEEILQFSHFTNADRIGRKHDCHPSLKNL